MGYDVGRTRSTVTRRKGQLAQNALFYIDIPYTNLQQIIAEVHSDTLVHYVRLVLHVVSSESLG
jgi:hypothetical protein